MKIIRIIPAGSFLLLLVSSITSLAFPQAKCKIKLQRDASKTFRKLLRFQPQWVEFHLRFNGLNVENLTQPLHFDELSNPKLWLWIYSHDERIVRGYDSDIYTLGLVNNYVKSMYVSFEVPNVCRSTGLDRKELFRQVYGKLEEIVMVNTSFRSLLCYEANLCRSVSISSPAKYHAARYLGMMRFVHERRCCHIGQGKSTNISDPPWDCDLYLNYKRLNIINMVGAVIFAFSPFFILKLFGSRTQKWILLHNGTFHELRDNHTEWLKPDENISIFFWTILKTLTNKPLNCFMRRFVRIAFVFLTPIVIYVMLIVYYILKYNQLLIYLIEGVPIGYLSMMFGVRRNFENTGGFAGGLVVSFSVYYLVGFILISIPANISKAMSSHVIRQSQSCTFLQVNIEFLEKYGSVEVRRLHGFERVNGILKARILMVINPSFWVEFASVWLSRPFRLTDYHQATSSISKQAVRSLVLFLASGILLILCLLEACLCLLYYSLPISFIFFTVPRGYLVLYVLPRIRSHQIKSRITGIMLAVCIISGFPFFYMCSLYIFCVSFYVVSRFVIQTFSVMILNPGYSMYLIAILFCLYYIHSLGRQVVLNYRCLLSISIQIAEKAQSEEESSLNFDRPFVLVSYTSDKYIRSDIFFAVINKHFPLRYELAWVLVKASVVLFFLSLSLQILMINNARTSAFYKSVWVFFTACLPKLLNVVHHRDFCTTKLEESIYRILQKPSGKCFVPNYS